MRASFWWVSWSVWRQFVAGKRSRTSISAKPGRSSPRQIYFQTAG
ncbi:hypothetical protein [Lysobacter gummosus]